MERDDGVTELAYGAVQSGQSMSVRPCGGAAPALASFAPYPHDFFPELAHAPALVLCVFENLFPLRRRQREHTGDVAGVDVTERPDRWNLEHRNVDADGLVER